MPRALVEKLDNMQEQIDNVSGEMEILMNKKEILEIKNVVTEMKNTFEGFISRLGMAKERICAFEDITVDSSTTEKQTKKD